MDLSEERRKSSGMCALPSNSSISDVRVVGFQVGVRKLYTKGYQMLVSHLESIHTLSTAELREESEMVNRQS